MTIDALLADLRERGIDVSADGDGGLHVRGWRRLADSERQRLASDKLLILAALRTEAERAAGAAPASAASRACDEKEAETAAGPEETLAAPATVAAPPQVDAEAAYRDSNVLHTVRLVWTQMFGWIPEEAPPPSRATW